MFHIAADDGVEYTRTPDNVVITVFTIFIREVICKISQIGLPPRLEKRCDRICDNEL